MSEIWNQDPEFGIMFSKNLLKPQQCAFFDLAPIWNATQQNLIIMETSHAFKIFLVDDDSFCLNLYKLHLENINYFDITLFESETTFLHQLTERPDVIFLDYELGSLSGIEVLKKIKRFNPDIFVVFLSGQANIETAVNALKFGAFDYIVKGQDELMQITKVLLKIKEIQELMLLNKPGFLSKIKSLF